MKRGAIVSDRPALKPAPSTSDGMRAGAWWALVVLGMSILLALFGVSDPGWLSRLVELLALSSAVLSGVALWAACGAATAVRPDPWTTPPPPGSGTRFDLPPDDPQCVPAASLADGVTARDGTRLLPAPSPYPTADPAVVLPQGSEPTVVLPQGSEPAYGPPRFGRGSKAQRREWVLPRRVVQPGVACDAARLGDLTVRAASVVGPGHRCEEPAWPRQDAYAVAVDPRGAHFVAAVADGVSSSRRAEVGASVAAFSAAQLISAALSDREPATLDSCGVYSQVAEQMSARAAGQQWQDVDVCAALITAVIPAASDARKQRSALIAWVGDVSAWILREGRWACVAGDRKSDDGLASNAVQNPLPFGATAVETTRVAIVRGDLLVLATDGVGDGLAALPDLRDYLASRWRAPVPVSAFLDDVGYDAERFLDDRTAVCVWVGDAVPGRPGGA